MGLFDHYAKEKGLQLMKNYSDKCSILEEIKTDEARLRQILINLISNALRHTEKGSVTLKIDFEYEMQRDSAKN